MNTDDLIERMAHGLTPVAPLPSPGKRTVVWSVAAALYVGALVLVVAAMKGTAGAAGAAFWWSQTAAVVTSVLAGAAAFASVVPGSPSGVRRWAAAAAVVWLATLLVSTPAGIDWSKVPEANHEWLCVGFIVIGGAPLAAFLVRMLRRGAPLSPATTAAYAALAVAAFANVGACVALPHPNGAVTLAWHGGLALALVVLAAASGRALLPWRVKGDLS